jgi:hypothetical protein
MSESERKVVKLDETRQLVAFHWGLSPPVFDQMVEKIRACGRLPEPLTPGGDEYDCGELQAALLAEVKGVILDGIVGELREGGAVADEDEICLEHKPDVDRQPLLTDQIASPYAGWSIRRPPFPG